jgi:glycosyltransferase involved in cell wall biosynthesis
MRDTPFFSVIVPVWNGRDSIARCLEALRAQTYPRDRFEILVVDNGSDDDTPEIARTFEGVTVLSETKPGSYAARNKGLAHAAGEYVFFTDADCIPRPNWIEAGAAALLNPAAGVFAGPVELFRDGEGGHNMCVHYERLFAFRQALNVAEGRCTTANWLCRRSILLALGGFNDALRSGGDWEMSQRIAKAGYAPVYVNEMAVAHPVRATLDELMRKRRRVIGGFWTRGRSRSFLALVGARLRFDIGQMRTVLFESDLTLPDRLKVSALPPILFLVSLDELLRLEMGGDARRA